MDLASIDIATAIGDVIALAALVTSIASIRKSNKAESLQAKVAELDAKLKAYELAVFTYVGTPYLPTAGDLKAYVADFYLTAALSVNPAHFDVKNRVQTRICNEHLVEALLIFELWKGYMVPHHKPCPVLVQDLEVHLSSGLLADIANP